MQPRFDALCLKRRCAISIRADSFNNSELLRTGRCAFSVLCRGVLCVKRSRSPIPDPPPSSPSPFVK